MEIVVVWIVIAVVTAIVASSRGRHGFGWFLLGCLFSIFALILVALLPSLKQPAAIYQAGAPNPDTHVKCPDCRELVLRDARKCKHCGCVLIPQ